ncbi:MAG: MHYT domain-containing protein, partial [Stenotrophomonas sp.]
LPHARLALGALLMGLGIAWMHYVGMAALRMHPAIDYVPSRVALSIAIAVLASWAALYIALRMRARQGALPQRLAAAVVMGLAIVGMHYTGMAAARFPAGSVCAAASSGGIGVEWLAACVVLLTVAMMAVVLVISLFEQRMQARLLRRRNSTLSASLDDARKELFHASRHDSADRPAQPPALARAHRTAAAALPRGPARMRGDGPGPG